MNGIGPFTQREAERAMRRGRYPLTREITSVALAVLIFAEVVYIMFRLIGVVFT